MTHWTEPASLHRSWGHSRARVLVGAGAIVVGIAATNLTTTYSIPFLAIGPALQLLGWIVLPGAWWRRVLVILPAELAALALLAGPDFTGAFAVLLACWLFVRHRPGISYLVLIAPIALSFLLKQTLDEAAQNWVGDVAGAVTVIASAWVARWLAQRRWKRLAVGRGTALDPAADHPATTRQTPSPAE
jgi:hypothetical protein